jgi:hypothetical protein
MAVDSGHTREGAMGLEDELLARLADAEDAFVERKPTPDREEIREAAAAFANSVRAPDSGVIFLGVERDGTVNDVIRDADKGQREATRALQKCYPPLEGVQLCALHPAGKNVVAVVVPESRNRPHFTGGAFVRVGSETKQASPELFGRMIDERNDLCWELKPWVNRHVSVVRQETFLPSSGVSQSDPSPPTWWGGSEEAKLEGVNRFYVVVRPQTGHPLSFSVRRIMLEWDVSRNQPLLPVALSSVG